MPPCCAMEEPFFKILKLQSLWSFFTHSNLAGLLTTLLCGVSNLEDTFIFTLHQIQQISHSFSYGVETAKTYLININILSGTQNHTHTMENTIMHVPWTPGNSHQGDWIYFICKRVEKDVKPNSPWIESTKRPLLLQFFTQTKSCRIFTPCEKRSFESASVAEAPWLKTNTLHEWIYMFAFHSTLFQRNSVKGGRANYCRQLSWHPNKILECLLIYSF